MEDSFFLDEFEHLVYSQAHDLASIRFVAALARLQMKRGQLDEGFRASGMEGLSPAGQHERFCTRLASAASMLFANPEFRPPTVCLERVRHFC